MGLFGSLFGQADPQGYMMNIGQPQQPQDAWQMAMQPTQQQAAQSFQQQYGQPIGNMQAQNVQPQGAPEIKGPGFFGKGGMGGKMLIGALGGALDGVARWGGAQPGYANGIEQQREYAQRQQELQQQMQMRQQEREQQAQQSWQQWQQQQEYAQAHPDPTAIQRNTEYIASLPEDDPRRAIATQQTTGYGYSPEVMAARQQQQQELINARAAAQRSVKMTIPGKAASAGGGGHGAKKTINGMTFYNVGGKWFDNPEGR